VAFADEQPRTGMFGARNGTAGYAQATGQTPSFDLMPYGESLASDPVGTPAIYNPNMPSGSRWSNAGLASSNIYTILVRCFSPTCLFSLLAPT